MVPWIPVRKVGRDERIMAGVRTARHLMNDLRLFSDSRCQNIRYRAGRSPAQVAFQRMAGTRRNRAYRQRRREDSWGAW